MNTAILVIVTMGLVGAVFGFVLAYANKKFAVELNPLIHLVEDILPKGQCGACGFAGCQAYAEAVVLRPDVPPNLCAPGKDAVAKRVAELTGKEAAPIEPRVAKVKCNCALGNENRKFSYSGIKDCAAASMLHAGPKGCKYGCVGLGTCENACPFDAIKLNAEGLPVVDFEKCTGCAKCEAACPKKVIGMAPKNMRVSVYCSSKDKGLLAKKFCNIACIGCGICAKQCQHGAINMENNLPVVNVEICNKMCTESTCLTKCPTGAIKESKMTKT